MHEQSQPVTLPGALLALNAGSSSIRFAFYHGDPLLRVASGKLDRIGLSGTILSFAREGERASLETPVDAPDHATAVKVLLHALEERFDLSVITAVGHRIVHGGERDTHMRVTREVVASLRANIPFAPEHLPQEIALIEALVERYPNVPQVACFDTVFHQTIPMFARTFAIPRRFTEGGIRRYGFHGISYEYISDRLRTLSGGRFPKRAILAHFGNGVSMTALLDGTSVDTTMGFTPLGGLPMGTRSGDLDPGVVFAIIEREGLSVSEASTLLNHQSGLIGVSGRSSHMLDLLECEHEDACAKDAIDLFCYEARKQIGAYAAALRGIDAIVFSGGMGEHSSLIRARILEGLEFLGVTLDQQKNARHETIISPHDAPVTVFVIPTDEELMIAKTARAFSDIL